ncbi:GNAT family N-acetyltransferase [Candidatus Pelagibacter sp.]|nr:GNAT family N-acetyltransferase [Candidatus Pelagibacter sp.]
MNNLDNINYDIDLNDGVITFKNINTTLGFVRYNETAEVEYIFVNPMFRRQGLAKKLLSIVEEKNENQTNTSRPNQSFR